MIVDCVVVCCSWLLGGVGCVLISRCVVAGLTVVLFAELLIFVCVMSASNVLRVLIPLRLIVLIAASGVFAIIALDDFVC